VRAATTAVNQRGLRCELRLVDQGVYRQVGQ
jgi:hypothetical protein